MQNGSGGQAGAHGGAQTGAHGGAHTGAHCGAHGGGHAGAHAGGGQTGAHGGAHTVSWQTGGQGCSHTDALLPLEDEQPVHRSAVVHKRSNEVKIPSCFLIIKTPLG